MFIIFLSNMRSGLSTSHQLIHPCASFDRCTDASGQGLSAPVPTNARVLTASGVGPTQTPRPILLPTFSDLSRGLPSQLGSSQADGEVEFGIQDRLGLQHWVERGGGSPLAVAACQALVGLLYLHRTP